MKKRIMLLLMLSVMLLSGCSLRFEWNGDTAQRYQGEKITLSDEIKAMHIEWMTGKVRFVYEDCDTISISETANKELDDKTIMQYQLDDSVLSVKFCGRNVQFQNLSKVLTVTVPKELRFTEISVNTNSGDIENLQANAETVNCGTTSGDGEISAQNAETVSITSTSGDWNLKLSDTKNCNIYTTSGSFNLNAVGETACMKLETVSGDGTLSLAKAEQLLLSSTSGDWKISCEDTPKLCNVDTTSGDMKFFLPADASFAANFNTSSGDFRSDIPVALTDGRYLAGSGESEFNLNTASGDVKIQKLK